MLRVYVICCCATVDFFLMCLELWIAGGTEFCLFWVSRIVRLLFFPVVISDSQQVSIFEVRFADLC